MTAVAEVIAWIKSEQFLPFFTIYSDFLSFEDDQTPPSVHDFTRRFTEAMPATTSAAREEAFQYDHLSLMTCAAVKITACAIENNGIVARDGIAEEVGVLLYWSIVVAVRMWEDGEFIEED